MNEYSHKRLESVRRLERKRKKEKQAKRKTEQDSNLNSGKKKTKVCDQNFIVHVVVELLKPKLFTKYLS